MKKRLFAILTLTLLIVSWSFSFSIHADVLVIPKDSLPVLYDMAYGLSDGAELNISEFSSQEDFINAYKSRRGINFYNTYGIYNDYLPDGYENYQFNIPINYGMDIDTYNSLDSQYRGWLANGTPIIADYSLTNLALWNRYNSQYITKYLSDLTITSPSQPVYVPSNYVSYVETLENNKLGSYTFTDYNIWSRPWAQANSDKVFYNTTEISLYAPDKDINSDWTSYSSIFASYGYATIQVNSTNHTYHVIDFSGYPFGIGAYPDFVSYSAGNYANRISFDTGNSCWSLNGYYMGLQNNITFNHADQLNYFNTTDDCLQYVFNHFKNVYLYVDGVLWSYPGVIPDDIIATAPDVIFGHDGLVEGQDVHIPADPTDELGFDLTKFWDLINSAFDDPDKDVITFDDLVDGGVIVKGDGTTADDSDIKEEDLDDVLEEADDINKDEDDPYRNIIPPLPPLLPLDDFGDTGNPNNAFNGIHVLARIINVTNKSMPEDLMVVFWGIIFCLITLGLIKILHK